MKILMAPNPFKGTLDGPRAARALAAGLAGAGFCVRLAPVSDGGDGLIDALRSLPGARLRRAGVTGPFGGKVAARWLDLGGTAVIEMAEAAGLRLAGRRRDPLGAGTEGVGELLRAAAMAGSSRAVVGLGGSASNDGGAGAARGFGFRLLDGRLRPLPRGASRLSALAGVERPPLVPPEVIALTDVSNPLCGPRGSARVFGPQKGASPAMVRRLERELAGYAASLSRLFGVDAARLPGGAAAGGLGAGLAAFFGARLEPGAPWVFEKLGLPGLVKWADLVVTGEGKLDRQTLFGKAPFELARLCRAAGRPLWAFCGEVSGLSPAALRRAGFSRAVSLSGRFGPARALAEPAACLRLAMAAEIENLRQIKDNRK